MPQQVSNAPAESQASLFSSSIDEQLFQGTDQEKKGYFTYEQFLAAMEWKDTEDSKSHFQTFDRNGDGKITPDEMRN
ncbi:hypothetical protein GQ44DRAFT_832434 [Phaeosphaeriaceae sp. PMI808]|nr:hypothetical protein GQ44DRAFT_832434 [Phaeosphaeriaceae sp. PMI808]